MLLPLSWYSDLSEMNKDRTAWTIKAKGKKKGKGERKMDEGGDKEYRTDDFILTNLPVIP